MTCGAWASWTLTNWLVVCPNAVVQTPKDDVPSMMFAAALALVSN
jgi:hypothetical protein